MRRLELWIQILEINENGDFVPVEVVPARDVETGGIFQLRQVGIIHTSPEASGCNWAKPVSSPFPRVSRGGSRWMFARFRTRGRCL